MCSHAHTLSQTRRGDGRGKTGERLVRTGQPRTGMTNHVCRFFFFLLLLFQTSPRSRPSSPSPSVCPSTRSSFFPQRTPVNVSYGTCQAGLLVPDGNPAVSPRTLFLSTPNNFFFFFFFSPSHQSVGALVAELLTTTRSPVSGMPTT